MNIVISSLPIDVVNMFYVHCLSNIWRWNNVCVEYTLMVTKSNPGQAACPARLCCQHGASWWFYTWLCCLIVTNETFCHRMSGPSVERGSSSSLMILCPQLVHCCHICQDFTTQLESIVGVMDASSLHSNDNTPSLYSHLLKICTTSFFIYLVQPC